VALVGIALVAVSGSSAGAVLTLGGLVGLMYFIHRYGRLGPESPASPQRR
jgi:hypothetical protein